MLRFIFNPITTIIITLLLLFFWISLYRTGLEFQQTGQQTQNLQAQVSELTGEVDELAEELVQSKSKFKKEKILRDELLQQKEGEYILKIETENSLQAEINPEVTPQPMQTWMKLFLKTN